MPDIEGAQKEQPEHEDHGGTPVKTEGSASFLRAARAGHLDRVLEFLKSGTDINTCNANGLNALHLASKEGHADVVKELLRRGANVDSATKKGNTSLHIASLAGQKDIVKILVDSGGNVNVQSQNGFTPLYMAAQENHDEVVTYLLTHGANQSLATEDGFTPLAVALQQGHDRVVAILLENDTRGKVRLPALHIAAKKDDTKAASLLLQNEHNPDVTSKSGFTPLHIAAHYGNDNVAQMLLEKGANVNYQARHNITPLHVASKWGRANMVTILLAHGAVIDCKTRDLLTPLHCAARSGHDQVVDLLLEKGAPISAKTKNGLAPLHMAAQGDHVDSARILLYHRAPVDDVTVDYLTPLHVAAHCGHVRVAKLLLDRGGDANARALNGFTPLHIACKKNRIKVVELLLKYQGSIEATTESGLTPLHVASFMGAMNIVIFLIQHGANPDVTTVRGETPLHLAARANQTDIIRILLRNGATVDARAREQQTPLHIASRLGNTDIVMLLLQAGADVNAATRDQYTPLHIAAKEGQEEVAASLLDHGAEKSSLTKKGFTPLHLAAKYGNLNVAKLLLDRGVPVDVEGKNQVTPLHVAAHYNNENVALLLLERKASPHASAKNGYTPLHIAAKKNQMEIANTLLNFKANPKAESKAGFTPLHLGAQEGHQQMSSLLMEHGADENAKAKNGLTPLHLCAQEDRVNVAEALVKRGAEIDPQTKAGYTPLHVAAHFGQINMVRFLLQHGAQVDPTTRAGYTPLHQASQQGHNAVVRLLLDSGASPNAKTTSGQTPLSIAQRLGYVSVVETLKTVTETTVITETTTLTEERYKPQNPEVMNETFMSESEDEETGRGDLSGSTFLGADKDMLLGPSPFPTLRDLATSENALNASYYTQGSGHSPGALYGSRTSTEYQQNGFGVEDTSMERLHGRDIRGEGRGIPTIALEESGLHEKSYDREDAGAAAVESFGEDLTKNLDAGSPGHLMMQTDYQDNMPLVDKSLDADRDNLETLIKKAQAAPVASANDHSFEGHYLPDNVEIGRHAVHTGFLISFMVDARGGAMRGCRHSGVRIIVPPRKAPMPMRVTCRYLRKDKLANPPPLCEGEALASRILEMGPSGAKFLGPVILEVPHFASLRGREREIVILRSDDGQHWKEHQLEATEDAVQEVLNESFDPEELSQLEDLNTTRITRILTNDFPAYFAIVTRVRQEVHAVGPEGGMIVSTVVPQVQAVFPEGSLTKTIKVSVQAQSVPQDMVTRLHGNRVAVSPIVTVEPRRRKFHKPITLCIPLPQSTQKGMITQYSGQPGQEPPTLRLLCSITGGSSPAQWEDITGTTQLTFTGEVVSFTTTVSARFWLMDCQTPREAARMGQEVYNEAINVPYMAKFVVFARRTHPTEGQLRVFCMTDDKEDKTLEKQEHFTEIAKSRDVECLANKHQHLEFAGNLAPVTKSGDQLCLYFLPFQENRLAFLMKVRDRDDPDAQAAGRIAFMKEAKARAENLPPQHPICTLAITLPDYTGRPSGGISTASSEKELMALDRKYAHLRSPVEDNIQKADLKFSDIAREVGPDWQRLARALNIPDGDVRQIRHEYPGQEAITVLRIWTAREGPEATGNNLERALRRIGREDVVMNCITHVESVTTIEERRHATHQLRDKNESMDVSYDEKELQRAAVIPEEPSNEYEREARNRSRERRPSPSPMPVTVVSPPEPSTPEEEEEEEPRPPTPPKRAESPPAPEPQREYGGPEEIETVVAEVESPTGPEVETISVQRHRREINIDFGEPSQEEDSRDKEEMLQQMAEELGEWEREHPADLPKGYTPTENEDEITGVREEPIEAVQSPDGDRYPTGVWNLAGSPSQQPSFEGSVASSEASANTVIYRGEPADGQEPIPESPEALTPTAPGLESPRPKPRKGKHHHKKAEKAVNFPEPNLVRTEEIEDLSHLIAEEGSEKIGGSAEDSDITVLRHSQSEPQAALAEEPEDDLDSSRLKNRADSAEDKLLDSESEQSDPLTFRTQEMQLTIKRQPESHETEITVTKKMETSWEVDGGEMIPTPLTLEQVQTGEQQEQFQPEEGVTTTLDQVQTDSLEQRQYSPSTEQTDETVDQVQCISQEDQPPSTENMSVFMDRESDNGETEITVTKRTETNLEFGDEMLIQAPSAEGGIAEEIASRETAGGLEAGSEFTYDQSAPYDDPDPYYSAETAEEKYSAFEQEPFTDYTRDHYTGSPSEDTYVRDYEDVTSEATLNLTVTRPPQTHEVQLTIAQAQRFDDQQREPVSVTTKEDEEGVRTPPSTPKQQEEPVTTDQQKESMEEGFIDEHGNVVVSKKVTRVVTTTRTVVEGDDEVPISETVQSVHTVASSGDVEASPDGQIPSPD